MKILLVDDEEHILSSLKRALEKLTYIVDCSNNAKQAVQMIKQGDYDFALIDYMMPENDGIWINTSGKKW